MNDRLENDLALRLARRALAIIAPCLREEEHRDAFDEFVRAFREEVRGHQHQRLQSQDASEDHTTRKQRVVRIKEILLGSLMPEVGGQLLIDVDSPRKDCLRIKALNNRGPGRTVWVRVELFEPNVLQTILETLNAGETGE